MIDLNMKIAFNDICMREMGLDITDDGRLYDMDTTTILQYNEKFIKYIEDEYTLVGPNEIELNLLENSRIMQTLMGLYLDKYSRRVGINITSYYSSSKVKGERGYMAFTSIDGYGRNMETRSDIFLNESVRMFSLICKVNSTTHLYDLSRFDIISKD